jgi:hypothetical protein
MQGSYISGFEHKLVQSLWKTVWRLLNTENRSAIRSSNITLRDITEGM